jgi:hypothetical protein
MRLYLVCGVLTVALGIAGCGNKDHTIRVGGMVTWEDGTPIGQAQVEFMPQGDGKPATGFTDDNGRFDLTTNNQNDGAVPGRYKVIVVKRDVQKALGGEAGTPDDVTKAMAKFAADAKAGKRSNKSAAASTLLPEIYSSVKTTPLQWTVESGGAEVKLTLKK